MTDQPSLRAQLTELELTGIENAAHIELLEKLGKRSPEEIALKRRRLVILRAAYVTVKKLAQEQEP